MPFAASPPPRGRSPAPRHGDTPLPDDGFASGPVAEQLLGGAARGGDAEIPRMAIERVRIPDGDPRWHGLLVAPLKFWNHGSGPWCHPGCDRTTYLTCFRMILEKSGPPNQQMPDGATILHLIATMGGHVTTEERRAGREEYVRLLINFS